MKYGGKKETCKPEKKIIIIRRIKRVPSLNSIDVGGRWNFYFRWIKCILGNRHWLAESPQGVGIQIYLALIGALMRQARIGQRPNKRMFEAIHLYLMGIATLDELEAEIEYQLVRIAAAKSKKQE